jgi:hypothetical protein
MKLPRLIEKLPVFFQRDAERSPVYCLTKRTGSSVTLALQLERIEEVIVLEHVLKGDPLLELFEGKNIGFLHE